MPADYFSIGIRQQIVDNEYAYLIATPNLRLQSVKAMQAYLEDNLRIDFSAIDKIDLDIIRQCIEERRKKGELGLLNNFLIHINNKQRNS